MSTPAIASRPAGARRWDERGSGFGRRCARAPIIGAVLHGTHWHTDIERYAPMTAGLAIQAATGLRSLPKRRGLS